jgi:hypothetical protein
MCRTFSDSLYAILAAAMETLMANLRELEQTIAHNRSKLIQEANEHPRLAAVAAYDAITELLVAVVKELQDLRRA